MKIKAVIFDLDDTLYDCTGSLIDASRRRAAKALVEAGLPCTEEEVYQLQKELTEKYGPYYHVFNEIVNKYNADSKLVTIAYKAYNSSEVSEIKLFPYVIPALKELTHLPVIADPSHGTGRRSLVLPMARASIAAGADGIIVEIHPHPDQALTDAQQTIDPQAFQKMMKEILAIHHAMADKKEGAMIKGD